MQQIFDDRIQQMESRILGNEQSFLNVDRKGDTNQGILSEIVDKMESKVLQMEQQLDSVKNEFVRDRENMGRIELTNLRNNEDFKTAVGSVQVDFGQKLELRVTEMVNRLLQEQEERLRQIDEIKYTIDMKDKITQQQSKNEREEMRDRYQAMDSVVKAEFQRKDEAIMGIQQSLETQLRTINGWIKQEELARS